jgi:hypothetical protein
MLSVGLHNCQVSGINLVVHAVSDKLKSIRAASLYFVYFFGHDVSPLSFPVASLLRRP